MTDDKHKKFQSVAFSPKINAVLLGTLITCIDEFHESIPSFQRSSFLSRLGYLLLQWRDQDKDIDQEDTDHIRHILQMFHDRLKQHGETFSDEILTRYLH